ncbi:hypothetical protein J6590_061512 [Homalodisca vitripennis]|nr:hypothetical protein J6590_061512 [Homalodisca vitripennis]
MGRVLRSSVGGREKLEASSHSSPQRAQDLCHCVLLVFEGFGNCQLLISGCFQLLRSPSYWQVPSSDSSHGLSHIPVYGSFRPLRHFGKFRCLLHSGFIL